MKLSHSKLNTILTCPATYYLNYIEGIKLKVEKSPLLTGSAVHWGIENNKDDLTEFYDGAKNKGENYLEDKVLAEAIVHGYLNHKDELLKEILKDPETGEQLELIEEIHELVLESKLKSYCYEDHDFMGIIDLLLLTNKGFIIIDYKTSSTVPEWDKYLDQIYRYDYLMKQIFPETPVIKVGIINLRKTKIKQNVKKGETFEQFSQRLKLEYEINDSDLINYHEFSPDKLDKELLDNYIKNLSLAADTAYMIDASKNFYINFNNTDGIYGKSPYWDIFYKTPDNYLKYNIKDRVFDPLTNSINEIRDCVPIDMKVIDYKNVLNKYFIFEQEYDSFVENVKNPTKSKFNKYLKGKYITDDNLLQNYWTTLEYTKGKII